MTELITSPGSLYDPDHALLARDAYVNESVYEQELDRIFRRGWMFVGHESQVAKPNDFFVSRMGTDSVILTRNAQGRVHVLLNSCRHKGMRVCRYDEGNARRFQCPYHAWTYSTDGSLVEAPGQLVGLQQYKEAYEGKLDKVEWGLIQARSAIYKGLVFATWDPEAPEFAEQLGDMIVYMDALLDGRDGSPGGSEAVGGVLKWRINSNWKAATENFIGDPLHGVSHRSVEMVGIGPTGSAAVSRSGIKDPSADMIDVSFPRWGHGVFGVEPSIVPADSDVYPHFQVPVGPADVPDVVDRWHREAAKKRAAALEGTMSVEWPLIVGGLFPNMAFHTTFPRTIAVFHPVAPGVCEAWRWLLVDKGSPKEVRDLARHHFLRYSGPAGMTEQDDMENWSYLTAASRGTQARRHPYNYQARLYADGPTRELHEGRTSGGNGTEGSIRSYYRAWSRHMAAESWEEYNAMADREMADMDEA
ncbi:MAG TPA: Rieske 2Fe-2S domain-containing protein [Solirubrobacteraceae bacterium]|jgi:phenylpropionate dioxygenase-like ring-hydroxylating dioxygenase large terminal subunit|nr:Rieske 2Fe-2S domain-containing protein [Solirubrobacteraceae bacterium]